MSTLSLPETPSQRECREWWTKAQPHVHRAWGRDKHGHFLAEESRLLHQAWVASHDGDYTGEHEPDPDEASTPDDPRTLHKYTTEG